MKTGKTSGIVRSVSALAILIYGGFMLYLGVDSILYTLFYYFIFFVLTFSEMLETRTYRLSDKEVTTRTVIHATASFILAVFGIALLFINNTKIVEKGSFLWYFPFIIFGLDAISTLVVISVFKHKES